MRPETYHSRIRRRIVSCPIHWSRLLLHDPPEAASAATVQIMVECNKVRITCAEILEFVLVRHVQKHHEAEQVPMPSRGVEISGQLKMVEIQVPSHEVV